MRADNEARFTQSYINIANIAGLSLDLKVEDLLHAVQQWIEQQTSWLLIFDNANDLRIFKKPYSNRQGYKDYPQSPELLRFVPKGSGGTVIWISRDGGILGQLVGANQGIEVGAMTDQESVMLFRKLSGGYNTKESSESEGKLLELLQRLPLAIAQAAAYIRRTKLSILQYLRMFKESEDRQWNLLSKEFEDAYRQDVPNSVMHTWLISMKEIAQENQCGERILNTIAFLDNQGLPFELLRATAGSTFSEDDVLLAVARLIEYSFLQVYRRLDEGLPAYEQHRLVQLATRRALDTAEARSFSGEALKVIRELFPNGSYETWSSCELYLPHALKAITWVEAEDYNEQAPLLLTHIGMYYWQQGRLDEAEKLEVQVLELQKRVLGEMHPDTIMAMANLASTWQHQGRLDEAEKLEVQVLELQKRMLGEMHPNTIMAMANLASTWWQQGRSDEAEKLQVLVLELQKRVLGEMHPNTIRAMANLAVTWWQQGQLDEAEKLDVQVLELQKRVLGEMHPDTIRAMANLASTWQQQGRSDEAEKLEVQVLELQKRVVGEMHPNTIMAMANLASTWWQQGRLDEAEKLQVQVLELRKSVLGEMHPDNIRAMANLAVTWWQQGRLDEAEKLEVQVLELQKRVLGEIHPDTIRAMANLASTWQQQGRLDEAEKLEVQVLELQKRMLGEMHPNTIMAMANLASTWWQQGRSDEAEKLEVQVLELRKSVLGEMHPDTLESMNNLVAILKSQGKYGKAREMHAAVDAIHQEKRAETDSDPGSIISVESQAASLRGTESGHSLTTSATTLFEQTGRDQILLIFAKDDVLRPLYAEALQKRKLPSKRFENNLQRLIRRYCVELQPQAHDILNGKALSLIRNQKRWIARQIREQFSPIEKSRNKEMDSLREQAANKRPILEKYLAAARLQANTPVEDVTQDVISPRVPLNVDSAENDTNDSGSNSSDSDENSLKIDDKEDLEFPHFDEIKAFLVNGRPFQNFRANFQHFINPNLSKHSSSEDKLDPNAVDRVFSFPIVEKLQSSIAILIFSILWMILLCDATLIRLRFNIWKSKQFLLFQYTRLLDTIFGNPPLPPSIVRLEWVCVSRVL